MLQLLVALEIRTNLSLLLDPNLRKISLSQALHFRAFTQGKLKGQCKMNCAISVAEFT
jgi:hypothetical protein